MTNRDHAVILDGYLSNLTLAQRKRIIDADDKVIHAQLNLGINAQVAAAMEKFDIIVKVIGEIPDHDIQRIEKMITGIVKEEGDLKPGVL